MPGRRHFSVEAHIGSSLAKAARARRVAELDGMADKIVAGALEGCAEHQRPELTLALLDRVAAAAAGLHDSARLQACLGKLAYDHGAKLLGGRGVAGAKAKAEAVFGGGK